MPKSAYATAYASDPDAPGSAASRPTSPAVVRAVQVLDAIAASSDPLTLADLTRLTGAPKSSLHGMCDTLVQLQLVKRLPGGAMALGPHVMTWANAFLAQTQITEEFRALWDQTDAFHDATVTLSMLEGDEVVYLACQNGDRPLGVTFRIGMRLPAPYTATGKAMLSTLPAADVQRLFADGLPPPLTRASVASTDALAAELQQVRAIGYSVDNGQMREGMTCFGAPVFDAQAARAAGAIAVSYLTSEIDTVTGERIGQQVRALADRLSARLGAPALATHTVAAR
ncbi:Transcriptional repressor with succinate semialdehyde inducer, IclR family [Cupriavidus sp. U2]|uniref:IclR family transcriptional regulator n=1 Tax=Cupriavidus sp. U2 TaxID=2920269 RepID=UPI00129EB668|nr:IclR family transcriptional regulator [Cupriavidus sp. U2]KAI3590656.1 Transcriptional repressor with succinate semialdehyde inducer, IclR family [Cupriavidus sp. U2]